MQHQNLCNSDLLNGSWLPDWDESGSLPQWLSDPKGLSQDAHGMPRRLWGDMPAFDLLKLAQHEGVDYQQSMHLLFAGQF